MRPPVHRHEPGVVDELLENDYRVGRLDNLKIAVIPGARSGRPVADASFRQGPVFRAVGSTSGTVLGALRDWSVAPASGAPRQPFRRQGGDLPVGRIGNQRRAVVPVSFGHPELVVVARGGIVGDLLVP